MVCAGYSAASVSICFTTGTMPRSLRMAVALMALEPILLTRSRKNLIARLKRQYRAEKLDRPHSDSDPSREDAL